MRPFRVEKKARELAPIFGGRNSRWKKDPRGMHTHAAGFVSLRPRRRAASVPEELRAPIEVTLQALTAHFHMPLYKAASSFGIGVSSLKNVCRRLGLQGWPFQKKGRPRRTPLVDTAMCLDSRTDEGSDVRLAGTAMCLDSSTDEGSDLWFLASV
jgi:hypothetical protein